MSNQIEHEEQNAEFFNEWAKKYDTFRISGWFRYTQKLTLDQFNLRSDGKLLDVGCGTGYAVHTASMILSNGKACGIDISPQMITIAESKSESDRVEFICAGAEDIPYPENTFDYVMCSNSFHHYPDPVRALDEMRRVLVPNGRLVIFENASELSLYTWLWDKWFRLVEKGHIKYYTSSELGGFIEKSAFRGGTLQILRNEKRKHGKLFASIQVWSADKS